MATRSTTTFLSLPGELRNEIYRLAILELQEFDNHDMMNMLRSRLEGKQVRGKPVVMKFNHGTSAENCSTRIALASTCKLIRSEVLSVDWRQEVFKANGRSNSS